MLRETHKAAFVRTNKGVIEVVFFPGQFIRQAKKLLSVPKAEIDKQEAEYQKTRKAAKKRG